MLKKLLLGVGLVAVGKYLGRGQRTGLGRFTSLGSIAAMIAGAAATQLLERQKKPGPMAPAAPPEPAA